MLSKCLVLTFIAIISFSCSMIDILTEYEIVNTDADFTLFTRSKYGRINVFGINDTSLFVTDVKILINNDIKIVNKFTFPYSEVFLFGFDQYNKDAYRIEYISCGYLQ